MKIEYKNLYTHFIFSTLHRLPVIEEKHRQRSRQLSGEKYITGIVNNNDSHLHSVYANPEHVHFLISRSPKLSEESIATPARGGTESSQRFIMKINCVLLAFHGSPAIGGMPFPRLTRRAGVSKSDVDKVSA
jgi:REP element-mobilizing transposase RayT